MFSHPPDELSCGSDCCSCPHFPPKTEAQHSTWLRHAQLIPATDTVAFMLYGSPQRPWPQRSTGALCRIQWQRGVCLKVTRRTVQNGWHTTTVSLTRDGNGWKEENKYRLERESERGKCFANMHPERKEHYWGSPEIDRLMFQCSGLTPASRVKFMKAERGEYQSLWFSLTSIRSCLGRRKGETKMHLDSMIRYDF